MTRTMCAIVLREPGPVENLEISQVPIPEPQPGWVRISIKAFGRDRRLPITNRWREDG